MTSPRDCKELARRLQEAAQPMHGQTYHDLKLAAAILEDFGDALPGMSGAAVECFLSRDPSLYSADPEGV